MSRGSGARLGSLGERVRRPTSPYCVVDGASPGLVLEWLRVADEWNARVAYLADGALVVAVLHSSRLEKADAVPPGERGRRESPRGWGSPPTAPA